MLETSRFGSKRLAIYSTVGNTIDWTDAMDFFPYVLFLTFSIYSGLSLWRYGTTISTDVRATMVNPWASIFIATCGLIIAWVLTPSSWLLPYAVSAMEIVLLAAIVMTLALVEMNLRTLEEWDATLTAVNEAVLAAMAQNAKIRELQALRKVRHRRSRQSAPSVSSAAVAHMQHQTLEYLDHPSSVVVRRPSTCSVRSDASDSVLDLEGGVRHSLSMDTDAHTTAVPTDAVAPSDVNLSLHDPRRSRGISDALVAPAVAEAVHAAALEGTATGTQAEIAANIDAVQDTMHRVTGATLTRLRVLPTEAGNTKGTGDATGGTTAAGASGSGTVGKLSQLVGFGKFLYC
jgi:hypothetical protein